MTDLVTGSNLDLNVAELSGHGGFAATTREVIDAVWARFERFCAQHAQTPLPCSEDTVLAFLTYSADDLRSSAAKDLVTRIKQAHMRAGSPPPQWPRVQKLLAAIHTTAPAAEAKVNALTEAEAEDMAAGLAGAGSVAPRVHFLRAVLCLARVRTFVTWEQADPRMLLTAEDGSFQHCGKPVEFAVGSLEAEILRDASERIQAQCLTFTGSIRAPVDAAARRAGLPPLGPRDIRAMSERDFHTLLAHCDIHLDRNTRDLAWLTLGIHRGLRHISLAHLDITDVVATAVGFVTTYRVAKLAAGEVLVKEVRHTSEDPQSCLDVLCPACALHQQLEVCARLGRTSGPVFATYYGGRWRAMTRQNARLRILRAFEATATGVHADSDHLRQRRISTRTLRRTAATWACLAGMSMAEAAALVTDHRALEVFAGYVELGPEFEVHPHYVVEPRCGLR